LTWLRANWTNKSSEFRGSYSSHDHLSNSVENIKDYPSQSTWRIESDELKKVNSDLIFQHIEDAADLKLRNQLQRQLDWKKKKNFRKEKKNVKMKKVWVGEADLVEQEQDDSNPRDRISSHIFPQAISPFSTAWQ